MTDPVVPPRPAPPLPTDPSWTRTAAAAWPQSGPAWTGRDAGYRPAPVASGSAVFAAPYTSPWTGGWVPPVRAQSRALGIMALALAVVAFVGATIVGGVASYRTGLGLSTFVPDLAGLRFLSPVRDWVLLAEVAFWAGTALGVWSLVQGIVALVGRRGRGFGIAAVVTAPLGSVLFAAVVWIALWAGILSQHSATGIAT